MYVRHWYCIGWGVIKHFKLVIKRPFTENESESLAASGCLFWRWVQLMSLIKSISSAFFDLYNFNCLGSFAFMVVIAVPIFCKNNLMAMIQEAPDSQHMRWKVVSKKAVHLTLIVILNKLSLHGCPFHHLRQQRRTAANSLCPVLNALWKMYLLHSMFTAFTLSYVAIHLPATRGSPVTFWSYMREKCQIF